MLRMSAVSAETAVKMARLRTDYVDSDEIRSNLGALAYNAMQRRIALTNACIETCPLLGGTGLED